MKNTDVYLLVANSDNKKVASAAFSLIDRLQYEKPGVQVAAITVLFTLMCEVFKLSPVQLKEYIDKMVWDRAGQRYLQQFAAMKQYLEEDVKHGVKPTLIRKS